jgi:hypothetical protein
LAQAKHKAVSMINATRRIGYDELWLAALTFPMVWESDLRMWLKEWRDNGLLEWHGLAQKGRELLQGKNHSVSLNTDSLSI